MITGFAAYGGMMGELGTKFPHPIQHIPTFFCGQPPPGAIYRPQADPLSLTHTVEAERTARHHLMLCLVGQRPQAIAKHLWRTREKTVLMRVIGRPHDLVRTNIVGKHGDAIFDWLEADPAIALEQLARTRFRSEFIEPLVVEMPIHAVEQKIQPPPDWGRRRAVGHTIAPDHADASIISIVRSRLRRAVLFETINPHGWHGFGRPLMESGRGLRPGSRTARTSGR